MRYNVTLLQLILIVVFSSSFAPMVAIGQFGPWEAMTGVHAGYAAHMLDLGDGRYLFSGPSSHVGRNGHGLFLYTPGETALKDVTPSWGQVYGLAWADDGSVLFANGDGIWRSRDAVRWTQVRDTTATALNCLRDGNCYAAQANGSVLRSTDNGAHWELISTIPNLPSWFGPPRQFAMNNRGWMICAIAEGRNLVSVDRGMTWEAWHRVDDSARIAIMGDGPLLVTADSGRVIMGGPGPGLHVLSGNWMHSVAEHAFLSGWDSDVCTRAFVESPRGTVYLGIGTTYLGFGPPERLRPDTSGVLVSYDEGSTWRWLRRDIDVMNLLFTASGHLLASTMLDGFVLIDTADGSSTPLPCSYGSVTDLLFKDGLVLAAMDSCHVSGVVYSADFGESWAWSDTMHYTTPNLVFPTRFSVLGDGSVCHNVDYRSSDAGRSWAYRPLRFSGYPKGSINSITGFSDSTLLLSDVNLTTNRSFLYPFDSDGHWSAQPYDPGLGKIRQIFTYADDRLLAATENGLYLSSDRGATWNVRLEESGLNLLPLRDGAFIAGLDDPLHSYGWSSWGGETFFHSTIKPGVGVIDADGWRDYLFVIAGEDFDDRGEAVMGSGASVLGTLDREQWFSLSMQLPTEEITAICLDDRGHLYAGTRGAGVFRTNLPVIHVDPVRDAQLPLTAAVHPQPVRNAMTVTIELEHRARLNAAVYDLLGRGVHLLPLRDVYEAGKHAVPVDVAGLTPGTYLLVVTAANGSARTVLPFHKQ